MLYSLDKRSQEILDRLLYAGTYIKPAELANDCAISKRSVYYAINKISEWLKAHGVGPLEQDRTKGVLLSPDQIFEVQRLLSRTKDNAGPVFSPAVRQNSEICWLIISTHQRLYIEDFSSLSGVSRNTIINDLKEAGRQLANNGLKLVYDLKNGYHIEGDTVRKRALFFQLFPGLSDIFENLNLEPDWLKQKNTYYQTLKSIEAGLEAEYVPGILQTLSVFMTSLDGKDEIPFTDMDLEEITGTREYRLVHQQLSELSDNEQIYITLHLLGSRLQTIPVSIAREESEAHSLAQGLVSEFEKISYIYFDRQPELVNAIAAHLQTSLYRYRYGIQLGNPMLDSIKTEYEVLFDLTKKACAWLEKKVGFVMTDAEVAYLTLHFGAFITTEQNRQNSFRILIICPNGIGTGNMLKNEIRQLVPQATDIQNQPLSSYRPDHPFDLVVSTVLLPEETRQVVVHPILTDQDRVSILRKCMHSDPAARMEINEITRLAAKYMDPSSVAKFQLELRDYFSSARVSHAPHRPFGQNLTSFLRPGHIQITDEEMDWESAIRFACTPLILADSITENYVNSIIHDQKRGLYMFLADGLVLAHAATENGVKQVDISLTTFHRPVTFLNGKQAKIILVLAAEDQSKHIRILNDVLNLFSKKKNLEKIWKIQEPEKIAACIESCLESERKGPAR